jgi:hypothetical protein
MMDRTRDRKALKLLTILDEYSRECLSIHVSRHITSEGVLERLAQLFVGRGTPAVGGQSPSRRLYRRQEPVPRRALPVLLQRVSPKGLRGTPTDSSCCAPQRRPCRPL